MLMFMNKSFFMKPVTIVCLLVVLVVGCFRLSIIKLSLTYH